MATSRRKVLPTTSAAPSFKLRLPGDYVRSKLAHLAGHSFNIVDKEGTSWPVKLAAYKCKGGQEYVLEGWKAFALAYGVKAHDVLDMELLPGGRRLCMQVMRGGRPLDAQPTPQQVTEVQLSTKDSAQHSCAEQGRSDDSGCVAPGAGTHGPPLLPSRPEEDAAGPSGCQGAGGAIAESGMDGAGGVPELAPALEPRQSTCMKHAPDAPLQWGPCQCKRARTTRLPKSLKQPCQAVEVSTCRITPFQAMGGARTATVENTLCRDLLKYRGVLWDHDKRRWRACILNPTAGTQMVLGYYETEVAAERACDAAFLCICGPKAYQNLPPALALSQPRSPGMPTPTPPVEGLPSSTPTGEAGGPADGAAAARQLPGMLLPPAPGMLLPPSLLVIGAADRPVAPEVEVASQRATAACLHQEQAEPRRALERQAADVTTHSDISAHALEQYLATAHADAAALQARLDRGKRQAAVLNKLYAHLLAEGPCCMDTSYRVWDRAMEVAYKQAALEQDMTRLQQDITMLHQARHRLAPSPPKQPPLATQPAAPSQQAPGAPQPAAHGARAQPGAAPTGLAAAEEPLPEQPLQEMQYGPGSPCPVCRARKRGGCGTASAHKACLGRAAAERKGAGGLAEDGAAPQCAAAALLDKENVEPRPRHGQPAAAAPAHAAGLAGAAHAPDERGAVTHLETAAPHAHLQQGTEAALQRAQLDDARRPHQQDAVGRVFAGAFDIEEDMACASGAASLDIRRPNTGVNMLPAAAPPEMQEQPHSILNPSLPADQTVSTMLTGEAGATTAGNGTAAAVQPPRAALCAAPAAPDASNTDFRMGTIIVAGVYYNTKRRNWEAHLFDSGYGRLVYLGSFSNEEDANREYEKQHLRVYGRSAYVKPPPATTLPTLQPQSPGVTSPMGPASRRPSTTPAAVVGASADSDRAEATGQLPHATDDAHRSKRPKTSHQHVANSNSAGSEQAPRSRGSPAPLRTELQPRLSSEAPAPDNLLPSHLVGGAAAPQRGWSRPVALGGGGQPGSSGEAAAAVQRLPEHADLIAMLAGAAPGVQAATILTRARKLGKLQQSVNFMNPPDAIGRIKKLSIGLDKEFSPSVMASFLECVINHLECFKGQAAMRLFYRDELSPLRNGLKPANLEREANTVYTALQQQHVVEFARLEAAMDRRLVETCHFVAPIKPNKKQWDAIGMCLLNCVYVMVMPRRQQDWRMMRFAADGILPNDRAFNYYLMGTDGSDSLIFNDFKTKAGFGQQIFPVPASLSKVVRASWTAAPGRSFLFTTIRNKDAELSRATFSRRMRALLPDVDLTCTIIRKMFATEFGHLIQPIELASGMAHSIRTNDEWYNDRARQEQRALRLLF